ncbi:flagellar hook-length control protein FliK [Sulfitobacter aestuariivivens]|uniref:flagellar hook-length control protein FliK n=1 Tax=Sulfitobacter aestuariivivens TaxID=2766981 RepID=UPI00361832B8
MALQMADTGIVVTLLTERPETLDLMRRHIDQLGQEFRALGYEDVTFSFANKGGDRHPKGQETSAQVAPAFVEVELQDLPPAMFKTAR